MLLIIVSIAALAFLAWAVMTKVFGVEFSADPGEWIQQTLAYSAEDFADVDIDVSSYKVFIGTSLDERAHLEYYENDKVKFDVSIPETMVIDRRLGEEIKVRRHFVVFDSLPDKEFAVEFEEATTQADSKTQTFTVTFSMPVLT